MIKFKQIEISLGKIIQNNKILEGQFKLQPNSILKKTGIRKRYISSLDQTSEILAINCCKKIKKKYISRLTHIISVSNTPSHFFPSISQLISSYLNVKQNTQCLSLNLGCSGFVDALILSYDIVKSNKNATILLITTDTYSKYIHPKNKNIKSLFSDGASATIISYSKSGWHLKKKYSATIPKSQNNLILKVYNKKIDYIYMNGPEIVSFATKHVIPKIKEFLNYNQKQCLIVHQAGKIVLDQISRVLNKKILMPKNYQTFGNLVSTSIPLVLKKNLKKIEKYKNILFCGFGVGLTHSYIKLIKK